MVLNDLLQHKYCEFDVINLLFPILSRIAISLFCIFFKRSYLAQPEKFEYNTEKQKMTR